MNLQATLSLAFGATLATALTLTPNHADACGGFFCDSAQPVNQQAERIIFHQGEDGSVTAVIQIQYQGEAEEFAWMLPVAGTPDVAVSSNAAFTRLQNASNPPTCSTRPSRAPAVMAVAASAVARPPTPRAKGPVSPTRARPHPRSPSPTAARSAPTTT